MRTIPVLFAIALLMLFSLGCESTGNPFAGSQWDVGEHHVSFSHAVADWNTTANILDLKFDLLSGSTYPDGTVTIDSVSTLTVNNPRQCLITMKVAAGITYVCNPADPDAVAEVTFTRLDLGPLGAVTGTITGMAKSVENPADAPVEITASFENVAVVN